MCKTRRCRVAKKASDPRAQNPGLSRLDWSVVLGPLWGCRTSPEVPGASDRSTSTRDFFVLRILSFKGN